MRSLQKRFQLCHPYKIELKKSPTLLKIKNTQPNRPTRHRQYHMTGLFLASCSSAELASASSGKTNVYGIQDLKKCVNL